ncbi:hypothetical protein CROQUDRAFT_664672 [Cronartium quercuum f. sp. fusiforme G11]|uniref:Uncharacterized protein n=1 Tax=Cronartium quercuum f. sp. fusiforme G11 TaxID=708437 RepID=A0A9P6T6R0_9BASI|nr:hypothetical protein CROQUDRAFT_664672 [Cronartium quercuum f. sp. fusiforme G11]
MSEQQLTHIHPRSFKDWYVSQFAEVPFTSPTLTTEAQDDWTSREHIAHSWAVPFE